MRKTLRFFIAATSIAIALTYFISSLTPFISQATFWPLSFLTLGFVFIAFSMVVITIYWFFTNKIIGFLLLIVLLFGYKNLSALYAFNFSAFNQSKAKGDLRILDWNVRHFVENGKMYDRPYAVRRKIFAYIQQMDPDVIMMQEFMEINSRDQYSNLKLFDSLGYKYYYLPGDEFQVHSGLTSIFGTAIVSKTPISDTQRFHFPSAPTESIIFGTINFNGRKVRLASMHLASLDLGAPDNHSEFYGRVDKNFLLRKTRLEKIKFNDSIHARQAEFVRELLDKCQDPVILSGDFNSVPGSYTYHKIKDNLQDCFIKKGYGFGRTFSGLSPTLRIDYILVNRQFKVRQYTSPAMYLSDHFPLVADLSWK